MVSGKPSIVVIMTGGTIDAEPYETTPDRVTPLAHSVIPDVVRKMGYPENYCDFYPWIMKDSQEFTQAEISELADIIRADDRRNFVITHGTDAMKENALLLDGYLKNSKKIVFFVGAMEPLKHGDASDGPANLKKALDTIGQVKEQVGEGVFIIGRGEIAPGKFGPCMFRPNAVEKDKARKLFVSLKDSA